jgi:hypothetical protein
VTDGQSIITEAVAELLVRVALDNGHEFGLRLLAAIGPTITHEALGHLWDAIVWKARELSHVEPAPPLHELLVDGDGQPLPDAQVILTGCGDWPGTGPG